MIQTSDYQTLDFQTFDLEFVSKCILNNMQLIIKIILSCLFIGCLFQMPYSYFSVVRILGMAGFAILAYNEKEEKDKSWMIVWAVSAIAINPIVKIPLGRELWNIVDLVWVGLFVVSEVLKSQKSKSK